MVKTKKTFNIFKPNILSSLINFTPGSKIGKISITLSLFLSVSPLVAKQSESFSSKRKFLQGIETCRTIKYPVYPIPKKIKEKVNLQKEISSLLNFKWRRNLLLDNEISFLKKSKDKKILIRNFLSQRVFRTLFVRYKNLYENPAGEEEIHKPEFIKTMPRDGYVYCFIGKWLMDESIYLFSYQQGLTIYMEGLQILQRYYTHLNDRVNARRARKYHRTYNRQIIQMGKIIKNPEFIFNPGFHKKNQDLDKYMKVLFDPAIPEFIKRATMTVFIEKYYNAPKIEQQRVRISLKKNRKKIKIYKPYLKLLLDLL